LKTVKVPAAMEAPFVAAEKLVSAYFQDRRELPEQGTIEIWGERYLLVRAASLSVEFFSLVDELYGPGRQREADEFSRNILFDLAHAIGKSDAHTFHSRMGLEDPIARLSAGPVHFSLTGWAFVDILPESTPTASDDYYLIYDHPYSFESDAWLRAGMQRDFAVCIMNSGYSSGWCEESFGVKLVATEVLCRGAGDEHCRFIMAHPDKIEQRVARYFASQPTTPSKKVAYHVPDFFSRKRMEEELRRARDDLEIRVRERTKELREANEQLVQTRKLEAVGRLAGGIAHDFNNIMAVVLGSAGLLAERIPPDDPLRPVLDAIREAGNHAATLTQQLLAFSRGQPRLCEVLQLNEILLQLGKMLEPLIGENIALTVTLDDDLDALEANRGQLEQVIVNLVVNARDAMRGGGSLKIGTRNAELDGGQAERLGVPPGKYVCLEVTDSGIGMPDDVVAKIFDPFFTTKATSGAGLGLSTVYGIVKQSGGGISVTTKPQHGTTFSLYLPSVTPPKKRATPEAGAVTRHGSETLLLVEDQAPVRRILAELLRGFGYTVVDTGDPNEAARIADDTSRKIDLLLTDVVMPGMTGPQLALRVISTHPRIKVLYMSGVADASVTASSASDGATVLEKPFSAETLAERVRALLDEPSR
jgi:signal transduction histidine kinase/CheY-like chemotaxis protein